MRALIVWVRRGSKEAQSVGSPVGLGPNLWTHANLAFYA